MLIESDIARTLTQGLLYGKLIAVIAPPIKHESELDMKEILIYSASWGEVEAKASEARDGLAKTVNAILKSHPDAKFDWLQSSAYDYCVRTVLTVVVTLQ